MSVSSAPGDVVTSPQPSSPPVSITVTESRLPSSPIHLLLFILYFPIGCGLALVRFLLSFQLFLFATFWPLPYGWLRNYCLRTMCSYLLGVWVRDERRSPPPPPPSAKRRHFLNRRFGGENGRGVAENNSVEAKDSDRPSPSPSNSPSASASSSSASSSSPNFFSSSTAGIFAANSVTPLDGAMLGLLRSDICVFNTIKLNPLLSWLLGYRSVRPSRPGGVAAAAAAAATTGAASTAPLTALELVVGEESASGVKGFVTFPELTPTNGKSVLKFEEKFVKCRRKIVDGSGTVAPSASMPIYPVAIKFQRFPVDFAFSTIESSPWIDLFWLLWCPINVFTVVVLEEIPVKADESPREIAFKVQTAIAKSLHVSPVTHGHLDREEYVKRRLKDLRREESVAAASPNQQLRRRGRQNPAANGRGGQNATANGRAASTGGQMTTRDAAAIEVMVQQVKTVLPQVPTSVIRQDIKLTKDVDVSITRFLEGIVAFVPEEPSPSDAVSASAAASATTSSVATESSSSNSASLSDTIDASKAKASTTSSKTVSTTTLTTSSKTTTTTLTAAQFAKSPDLRHKTFEEKKRLLIQQSRERYLSRMGEKS